MLHDANHRLGREIRASRKKRPANRPLAIEISEPRMMLDGQQIGDVFAVTSPLNESPSVTTRNAVDVNTSGNFVVVWSEALTTGQSKVVAQRYDAMGSKVGPALDVSIENTPSRTFPTVAMADDGSFVVAWEGREAGQNDNDIYFAKFDASGNQVIGRTIVHSPSVGNNDREVAIDMNAEGDFVIAWERNSGNTSIQARLFDKNGIPVSAQEVRVDDTNGSKFNPAVAIDSNRNFVVAFVVDSEDSIRFRRFDANQQANPNDTGGVLANLRDATFGASGRTSLHPTVDVNDNGQMVVAWTSDNVFTINRDIVARRYTDAFGNISSVDTISEVLVSGNIDFRQEFPSAQIDESGKVVVSWESDDSYFGTGRNIYAKEFEFGGLPPLLGQLAHPGDPLLSGVDQRFASVGMSPNGDYVLVWNRYQAGTTTIEAKQVGFENLPTNTPPTLQNALADVVVAEDAGSLTIPLADVFFDADEDTLVLELIENTANPAIDALLSGDQIILSFAADETGIASFTIRATDPTGEFAEDTFQVSVTPIADAPTLSVSDASGDQDFEIPLSISGQLTDSSEDLQFRISGVPTGATLNTGGNAGGGVWLLSPADLNGLAITPPVGFTGSMELTITAMSEESDGSVAETSAPLAVEVTPAVNLSVLPPVTYGGNQDQGTATTSVDGRSVQLDGNAWKAVDFNANITEFTYLEVDFTLLSEGEIHGIGFDTDDNISADRTFRLAGTQNWGIDATSLVTHAAGTTGTVLIPVGQFFTGAFTKMTFVNDHDVSSPTASAQFANIRLVEFIPEVDLSIDGAGIVGTVSTYAGNQDKSLNSIEIDEQTGELKLSGNAWKKIALDSPVTITENTILEFQFTAEQLGEIHGIGFANDPNAIDAKTTFRVAGTQSWGINVDIDGITRFGDVYRIPVGQFLAGQTFDYLTLVNDDDENASAIGIFSNIQIYEATTTATVTIGGQTLSDVEVVTFGNQDKTPSYFSVDGETMTLRGNTWKSLDLGGVEITEDTVLTFDFDSNDVGEIHGIGFTNILDQHDASQTFRVAGSQDWGIDASQSTTDGLIQIDGNTWTIAIGQFYTGSFDYLVLIADDDSDQMAESIFTGVTLT